jgi:hypothetical protein
MKEAAAEITGGNESLVEITLASKYVTTRKIYLTHNITNAKAVPGRELISLAIGWGGRHPGAMKIF